MLTTSPLRTIKSFVLRQGRLTDRQQEALDTEWSRYVLPIKTVEDWSASFRDDPFLILEIGFGMGHSFFKDALAHPENHYIGIEVFKPGIGSLLSTLKEQPLSNINVLHGDAVEFLNTSIPDEALSEIHIFFPDPWPKRRHHKRRLIQPHFVKLLAQKLKPGGRLHLATDWEDYAKHMQSVLSAEPLFAKAAFILDAFHVSGKAPAQTSSGASGQHSQNLKGEEYGRALTKYERRGQKAGHEIKDLIFLREK